MNKHILFKSTFIRGLKYPKSLYLYKNHSAWFDPITPKQVAIFSQGTNVSVLSQELFPVSIL